MKPEAKEQSFKRLEKSFSRSGKRKRYEEVYEEETDREIEEAIRYGNFGDLDEEGV